MMMCSKGDQKGVKNAPDPPPHGFDYAKGESFIVKGTQEMNLGTQMEVDESAAKQPKK